MYLVSGFFVIDGALAYVQYFKLYRLLMSRVQNQRDLDQIVNFVLKQLATVDRKNQGCLVGNYLLE